MTLKKILPITLGFTFFFSNLSNFLLFCRLQSTPVTSLPKYKRSPNRRTKSRWEPLPEEKSVDRLASANNDAVKYSGWIHSNEKDRKVGLNSLYILISQCF